jgi:hypothetical protein
MQPTSSSGSSEDGTSTGARLEIEILAVTSPQLSPTSVQEPTSMTEDTRFSLGPDAPKFSGAPQENLQRWIAAVDFLLETHKWDDKQQLRAIFRLLRGPAQAWFLSTRGTTKEPKTWKALQDALTSAFRSQQQVYVLRERLETLRQKQFPDLEQYITAFHGLVHEIGDLSEAHSIFLFARGLTNKLIKTTIYNTPNCTLQGAYQIARSFTLGGFAAGTYQLPQPQPQPQPAYNDGVAPMELDAMLPQQKPRNDIICFNCKQPGHMARSCRRQRNNASPSHQHNQPSRNQQAQLHNVNAIQTEEWQAFQQWRQQQQQQQQHGTSNVQSENFSGQ